jgi:hypothetical protein
MTPRPLRLALLAVALAVPVHAHVPASRPQTLLFAASTHDEAMRSLRVYADSLRGASPYDAGEAWRYIAELHWRAGERDSAEAAFARAVRWRGDTDERLGLADALLSRRTPEAAEQALAALEEPARAVADAPAARRAPVLARVAMAHHRAGRSAAGAALLRPDLAWYGQQPGWARGVAPVLLAATPGDRDRRMVQAAAALTQGADTALVRLAWEAAEGGSAATSAEAFRVALTQSTTGDAAFVEAAGGGRVAGPLAARWWRVFPRRVAGGQRVVLLLPAWARGIAEADSLAHALAARGHDVLLSVVRAPGGLAHAPDGWERRAYDAAVVAEVRAALATPVLGGGAPPPAVVVAAHDLAMPAAMAAREDARIRGVVLIHPWPPGSERGILAGVLRAADLPVALQGAPETGFANEYADLLATRLAPTRVRVFDGQAAGTGYALFRHDTAARRRLTDWVATALATPRATPPTPPRTR